MIGDIKIALCISGEGRSSMFCFPYIYEHFINLGPRIKVDTYIHSWKGYRAIKLYNPKGFEIQANYHSTFLKQHIADKMGVTNPTQFNTIRNLVSMAYSIERCFKIVKTPYDIYIRIRPDLIFPYKFNSREIIEEFMKDSYDAYIPKPTRQKYSLQNGFNDQLAILNYKGMIQYSKILDIVTNFYDPNIGNFGEGYLKTTLDQGEIKVKHLGNIGNNVLVRNSEVVVNTPKSFVYLDE